MDVQIILVDIIGLYFPNLQLRYWISQEIHQILIRLNIYGEFLRTGWRQEGHIYEAEQD
jgi:hypothetical protein